ncbi:MAG: hypothetical protein Q9P90_07910 [candidate division KSB1 bacterium]|nr:hypothetical protein [candidate division KSB1 bacterium]
MHIAEEIYDKVKKLPEAFQKAVLDFTVRLSRQVQTHAIRDEEIEWNRFSLLQPFHDYNDDLEPENSESDIKVKW